VGDDQISNAQSVFLEEHWFTLYILIAIRKLFQGFELLYPLIPVFDVSAGC